MNKLQTVKDQLSGRVYHSTDSYLAFVAKTGEAHTVAIDGEELIVSGSTPKQPMHKTKDVTECIAHIQSIA